MKQLFLTAMLALLVTPVVAAPPPDGDIRRNADVTAARNYIKDTLKQDGRRDAAYFYWQETNNAPLADVRITSTTVTFITDPAFEFEFPLKNLKFSTGSDGALRIISKPSRVLPASIGKAGNHAIGLPDSLSKDTANKIVADFAVLSQAAPPVR